jgi:TPR repeat protein
MPVRVFVGFVGLLLLLAVGYFAAGPRLFAQDASEECRKLAASPNEPGQSGSAVEFKKIDAERAFVACGQAARRSTASAADQFRFGRAADAKMSYSEALEFYKKAADRGYAPAYYGLAILYSEGNGVPLDERAAITWYRKAAESGFAGAQVNLGIAYAQGIGVPRDGRLALEWHRKAADQGNLRAINDIGSLYWEGNGVSANPYEAAKWFRAAADKGFSDAQYNLGLFHETVTRDFRSAAEWYEKAARQGAAFAQINLGLMLCKGQGVARDMSQAQFWMRKAAEQSNEKAIQILRDFRAGRC